MICSLNPAVGVVPGVLNALQRCLPEACSSIIDHSLAIEVLGLLEKISLLLLGVLYGDQYFCATEQGKGTMCRHCGHFDISALTLHGTLLSFVLDVPPSFCDMGNAISSLITQASGGNNKDGEGCVLLSEAHSLVLTCCWVSLKVKQN